MTHSDWQPKEVAELCLKAMQFVSRAFFLPTILGLNPGFPSPLHVGLCCHSMYRKSNQWEEKEMEEIKLTLILCPIGLWRLTSILRKAALTLIIFVAKQWLHSHSCRKHACHHLFPDSAFRLLAVVFCTWQYEAFSLACLRASSGSGLPLPARLQWETSELPTKASRKAGLVSPPQD